MEHVDNKRNLVAVSSAVYSTATFAQDYSRELGDNWGGFGEELGLVNL